MGGMSEISGLDQEAKECNLPKVFLEVSIKKPKSVTFLKCSWKSSFNPTAHIPHIPKRGDNGEETQRKAKEQL